MLTVKKLSNDQRNVSGREEQLKQSSQKEETQIEKKPGKMLSEQPD